MKPWWKSKIIWASAIAIVVELLALWLNQDWLSPKTLAIIGLIHAHLVIVLRWVTEERITSVSPRFDRLQSKAIKKLRTKGPE